MSLPAGFDRVHQLTDDQQGGVAGVVLHVAQTLLRDVRTLGVQQLHVVAVVFIRRQMSQSCTGSMFGTRIL